MTALHPITTSAATTDQALRTCAVPSSSTVAGFDGDDVNTFGEQQEYLEEDDGLADEVEFKVLCNYCANLLVAPA